MNKVDSSSLASFTSPLYRLTTPAAREEQGTSIYLRYNIPPHAPRAGSAKEATSGVFAGPAWPDFASPAVASLGAIPPGPPVAARAAGEAAGLDGSENSMDLNVPDYDRAATSLRMAISTPTPSGYFTRIRHHFAVTSRHFAATSRLLRGYFAAIRRRFADLLRLLRGHFAATSRPLRALRHDESA